jgi:DNA-directed RNA polymerase sigma subunit (sigma70/sigma32)
MEIPKHIPDQPGDQILPTMPDALPHISVRTTREEEVELAATITAGQDAASQLRRINQLPPDEIKDLSAIREEGLLATSRLVLGNLRFGDRIADTQISPDLPQEDCEQIARLGLAAAAHEYDPGLGRFGGQAAAEIRKEFKKSRNAPPEQPLSFDDPVGEHGEPLGAVLPDQKDPLGDVERDLLRAQLNQLLPTVLASMDQLDRGVFLEYFGTANHEGMRFREIDEAHDFSPGQARAIYYKNLIKLAQRYPQLRKLYQDFEF